jgi:hypothetical protein
MKYVLSGVHVPNNCVISERGPDIVLGLPTKENSMDGTIACRAGPVEV